MGAINLVSAAVPRRRPARQTGRAIDLAHLMRRTMGDRALEQQVLAQFIRQAVAARDDILKGEVQGRLRLLLKLKGSARDIGAFRLADCLAELEKQPQDRQLLKTMSALIDELCNFVAAVSR